MDVGVADAAEQDFDGDVVCFSSRLSMVMGASGLPAAGRPQAGIFFISGGPSWRKPATGLAHREAIAGTKPPRTGWAVQVTFTMLSRRSVAALLAGLLACDAEALDECA